MGMLTDLATLGAEGDFGKGVQRKLKRSDGSGRDSQGGADEPGGGSSDSSGGGGAIADAARILKRSNGKRRD